MSYLDAAVSGTVITEPALKQSAKGNAYLRILAVVGNGDGKQFVWICCFGKDAERVAPQLIKGGKIYAEGAMSSEVYTRDDVATVSLSIAARRIEVLNQIGRNRPKESRRPPEGYREDHENRRGANGRYGAASRSADYHRPLDDGWPH